MFIHSSIFLIFFRLTISRLSSHQFAHSHPNLPIPIPIPKSRSHSHLIAVPTPYFDFPFDVWQHIDNLFAIDTNTNTSFHYNTMHTRRNTHNTYTRNASYHSLHFCIFQSHAHSLFVSPMQCNASLESALYLRLRLIMILSFNLRGF